MEFIPTNLYYPESEKEKLRQIKTLFKKWYKYFKGKKFVKNKTANKMVFDGFYPYYFSQKRKVLFIGIESYLIEYYNYISYAFDAYKKNYIGDLHINRHSIHRRMIKIAYGLSNSFLEFQKIPKASEITEQFGTSNGVSFAFMNISKFSNESGGSKADWELIDSSIAASSNKGDNFILNEIDILEPDIVITMNLGKYDKLSVLGKMNEIFRSDEVYAFNFNTQSKNNILLLDTFHFSARSKADENDFYGPIVKVVKKYSK
ncbi:MAG: hypothetical protein BWX72_00365 [Firmicutes bacterium ADurb.Bin080]|nr:MAG: hypothetical protein BWX72_00365 [Firmicutes bacterium ADurb.Bin080]